MKMDWKRKAWWQFCDSKEGQLALMRKDNQQLAWAFHDWMTAQEKLVKEIVDASLRLKGAGSGETGSARPMKLSAEVEPTDSGEHWALTVMRGRREVLIDTSAKDVVDEIAYRINFFEAPQAPAGGADVREKIAKILLDDVVEQTGENNLAPSDFY